MSKSEKKLVIIIVSIIASLVLFFVVCVVCAFMFGDKVHNLSKDNSIMFQGFEDGLTSDGEHWNNLNKDSKTLSKLGVNYIWVPSACKAENAADNGYNLYDLYDLGEFDQKGSIRTKYGTKEEYLKLISSMHKNDIDVIASVVFNHKAGADKAEKETVVAVKSSDITKSGSKSKTINVGTVFTFPGRGSKYSSFTWNKKYFDGMEYFDGDYRVLRFKDKKWSRDIVCDIPMDNYILRCNIDFENKNVRKEFDSWAEWFVDTTYADGFAVTQAEHTSARFYKQWIENARKNIDRDLYSVADYYDNDINNLLDYVDITGGKTNILDYSLRENFINAKNGSLDMSKVFDNTVVSDKPELAITFADNHNTQTSPMDENAKALTYASILTREGGIPCIFYGDYYGTADGTIKPMADKLNVLMAANQVAAYGKQEDYLDDKNVIGWVRKGNRKHNNYAMAVVISVNKYDSKTMNVGENHKNEEWIDVTGNQTDTVKIDEEGNGTFPAASDSYSVWVSADAAKDINKIVEKVSGEEFEAPKDNTVTIFYYSDWNSTYVLHQPDRGLWADEPGTRMSDTNLEGYKCVKIDLLKAAFLRCYFSDAASVEDDNNGYYYKLKAGIYTIKDGIVIKGTPDGYDPFSSSATETEVNNTDIDTADNGSTNVLTDNTIKKSGEGAEYTIYYHTDWTTPYIHYRFGSEEWTEVPGIPMKKTSESDIFTVTLTSKKEQKLEICFNDGNDNWDSQHAKNYILPVSGSYLVTRGSVTPGTFEEAKEKFAVNSNGIVVYYYSNWATPHIKYNNESIDLTEDFGVPMNKTSVSNIYTYTIPASEVETVYVKFNDGKEYWDKNFYESYKLTQGSYTIYEGYAKPGNLEDAKKRFSSDIHNKATVYYHAPSDWKNCVMFYGYGIIFDECYAVNMELVDKSQNIYKTTLDLGFSETFVVAFDNDTNVNNDGYAFYNLSKGVTRIKDGVVTKE